MVGESIDLNIFDDKKRYTVTTLILEETTIPFGEKSVPVYKAQILLETWGIRKMVKTMDAIKRFDFTWILGWSISRYDKFLFCKRQYFYDYYGKHDKEFSRQKIDSLKKMTSVPLEIGNIVHDVVKTLLERLLVSEVPLNHEKFFAYARKMTVDYCGRKIFSELYYKKMDSVNTEELYETVVTCLKNFIESDRYGWLTQKVISNKKDWIIEPGGYGETRINGMKAYCKVDFLFPMDGKIYILDWKTGKRDEKKHKKQLVGYATWASYHFGRDTKDIVPIISYMKPAYSELEIGSDEYKTSEFAERVQNESEEMYAFCSNKDENIPVEKDRFEKTAQKRMCSYCNYRELCEIK